MTRRGFTLLEVMLALGIIVVLLGVMSSVIQGVADSRNRLMDRSLRDRGIAVAFEQLEAMIDTCMVNDGIGGAGIEGDELGVRMVRSGVPARWLNGRSAGGSPLGDRDTIDIRLEDGDLVLSGEGDDDRSLLLESPVAIRFRYHDGQAWVDSWNSMDQGFPVAVELSIWTQPWPDGDRPAWMPEPEEDLYEGLDDSTDGLLSEVMNLEMPDEPAASAMGLGMDESGVPEPDRVRIVAVFDPVSTGFGSSADGMENQSFDEPMEMEMRE